MSAELVSFIFIHAISLAFFVEVLRRTAKRANEYELKETAQTLPFGFVRLRHLVIVYVLFYLIWIVVSIFLYLFFINGGLSSFEGFSTPSSSGNIELNL